MNVQNFKKIFTSPKNSKHIFDIVISNLLSNTNIHESLKLSIKQHLSQFEKYLHNLQNHVFDNCNFDSFQNYEELLVTLNQSTISKFHQFVFSTISNQTTQNITTSRNIHLFSNNSLLDAGRYTFPLELSKIQSLSIDSFDISCNFYTITDSNNKFVILFNSKLQKLNYSIPIGHYTIYTLLEYLNILLESIEIQFVLNVSKNKIIVKSNKIFNIDFLQESLYTLLGFTKQTYINNNIYVSESHPISNLFDNVYIKLFLNDIPIVQYTCPNTHFSYFESFNFVYDSFFSKRFFTILNNYIFYTEPNIDLTTLSLELWYSPVTKHTQPIDFNLVVSFTC